MSIEKGFRREFGRLLLDWNREKNDREMPWKGEKDPYRVWLSEIILQQTRVDQGLSYYNKFIQAFPDIHALANAGEQKVFKMWEGLGYYTRCRNLIATAKHISAELGGNFPRTIEEIRKLKGVGPYTASAIASFAYNLPHAVLDGNVFRVLSRIFGIHTPIDSTTGRKEFETLANELIVRDKAASYNQAIMDFGATVCKPAPDCQACVFNVHCHAFRHRQTSILPVKEKKAGSRKRWFHYLVLEHKGRIAIRKRTARDIWQQLYEFPMIEASQELGEKELVQQSLEAGMLPRGNYISEYFSPIFRQQLSHQLIIARFIRIQLHSKPVPDGWTWIPAARLHEFPLPRIINSYLEIDQKFQPV